MNLRTPKGVFDITPDAAQPWRRSDLWQWVEEQVRALCATYGYQEIRTPIFEQTELFARGVGENSDIVSKEMYTFEDRGGRSMTLRPEGTAPVMRSFLTEGMNQLGSVHKFYYLEPMFRYERQQAGRYRQHHQFGVEAIGESSPELDVEVIDLLYTLCSRLGLGDLHLKINSLGDEQCRKRYREALLAYLEPKRDQLSGDSQRRLDVNPLRILDSKAEQDRSIVADAPSLLDSLEEEARSHFERVKQLLERLGIPYSINARLVRGLDYYNRTVFEVQCKELGALTSIGGGGRYDPLLAQLGGPDLPAMGFGCGLERLIQALLAQEVEPPQRPRPRYYLAPLGDEAKLFCAQLASTLRKRGVSAVIGYRPTKVRDHLRYANQIGARYFLAIGSEELADGRAELRDLDERSAQEVEIKQLEEME